RSRQHLESASLDVVPPSGDHECGYTDQCSPMCRVSVVLVNALTTPSGMANSLSSPPPSMRSSILT
ncbi:MAG: hypothetical protein ACI855_002467, partial [Myxococcota bacterium]